MNKQIKKLAKKAGFVMWKKDQTQNPGDVIDWSSSYDAELKKFAKLIIEETLKQVDEQVHDRGENSWYYNNDKKWIRLHFGYGELK